MEDLEPLVQPAELKGFPGAPFSDEAVLAASMSIRTEADWHIAPKIIETVTVETGCARVAMLNSMHVIDVEEVLDAETGRDLGQVIEDWRFSKSGMLTRRHGVWPELIEVSLIHGYAKCPRDLLPVVAERAQRSKWGMIAQENIGARSISLRQGYDPVSEGVLARYTLPSRP